MRISVIGDLWVRCYCKFMLWTPPFSTTYMDIDTEILKKRTLELSPLPHTMNSPMG